MVELYDPDDYRSASNGYHNRDIQDDFAKRASEILNNIGKKVWLVTTGMSGIILASAIKSFRPYDVLVNTEIESHHSDSMDKPIEKCVFIDDYIQTGETLSKAYKHCPFMHGIVIDAPVGAKAYLQGCSDDKYLGLQMYYLRSIDAQIQS